MVQSTWKRLWKIARPELPFILWGLLFLVLSSGTSLLFPQLIRWLIDEVLQPKRSDLLIPTTLSLFAAFSILGISGAIRYYLFSLAGERIVLDLRHKLYQSIISQDISFFDGNRTGDLMSRLSSDCTTLQNTVSVNVSQGLRNLAQVVGGFAFMFFTSWHLSLLMLLIIPPVAGCAVYFGQKIRGYAKKFQNSLAIAAIVAEETISGVRTVKSFVQETAETARYHSVLNQALIAAKQRILVIAQFIALAMIIGLSSICFVLWYGGIEVIADHLSIGDMTQFLMYLMIVSIGVSSLGGLWGDLMAGVGASKRVFAIIERQPEALLQGTTLDAIQGHLSFRNVSFSYPARPDLAVLDDVSFEIKPGQLVALVGASGGGKTTIANLIPRFYEPNSGAILLDGVAIKGLQPLFLRENIGVVAQEPILISATIEQNIRYGRPEATIDQVRQAAIAANALEFIESFPEGFATEVGEKGIQLSGGQKQRVAIARAILKDPRILLLDEATSNLDTASEALVQEALARLMQNRTTLLIAHRLATVEKADQIFVIQNGRVVQTGRHQDLSLDRDGLYFKLLQRQFAVDSPS